MKKWEAQIPTTPKIKERKRCYTVWHTILGRAKAGGKVVWLTDKQVTFYKIKKPNIILLEVLEKDRLEEYKKYMHQTID